MPEGKWSIAYGNVAIIDCNYMLDNVISTLIITIEEYKYIIGEEIYNEIMKRID